MSSDVLTHLLIGFQCLKFLPSRSCRPQLYLFGRLYIGHSRDKIGSVGSHGNIMTPCHLRDTRLLLAIKIDGVELAF